MGKNKYLTIYSLLHVVLVFYTCSGHIPVGVVEESGKLPDGDYLVHPEPHFGVPAPHLLHPLNTWKTLERVVYRCYSNLQLDTYSITVLCILM